MEEVVRGQGHENVSATHESTLEVTTDDFLTPAGDCIVAIDADRAPADFAVAFVEACRDTGATVTAEIEVGGYSEHVTGRGDPALTFESERSHVLRTSAYVDDRTVMVEADKSAADLDRDIVSALAGGAEATFRLRVE